MSAALFDNTRVLGLRELLERPAPAPADATAVAEPVTPPVDPAAELEALRQRVEADAKKAGHAQGMAQAEQAVAEAVADARREVERADAAVRAELQATVVQLKTTVRSLAAAVEKVDEAGLPIAITIALTAVARLVGQVHADRELMSAICRQALDEYRRRPVVIRLCCEDADAVAAAIADIADVRVEADSLLTSGECRLETQRGLYDTSLSTRLEAITRAIVDEVGAAR